MGFARRKSKRELIYLFVSAGGEAMLRAHWRTARRRQAWRHAVAPIDRRITGSILPNRRTKIKGRESP
jgi:hypothetical protein